MRIDPNLTAEKQRKSLEKYLNVKLPFIGAAEPAAEDKVRCENRIGGTILPLGIAGPLILKGTGVTSEYIIPLATTEGALVASVNRGCKAISESGGAVVQAERVGTTRGPVFEVSSLSEAFVFRDWLNTHLLLLKDVAEKTSSHLKLTKIEPKITGRYVFVRLYFETGDAMGMNMVTIATERIVALIEENKLASCVALSGNFCVDKKPSFLNFLSGRGYVGWAEVNLPEAVVRTVLKTTPQEFFEVWLGKSVMGSIASGTVGNNAHFANIVAAFFAATGQDMAHVVEGSLGMTTVKVLPDGKLYVGIYMPSIMVGTVGGGTNMKIKKEALSILQVKDATGLAKALAGAVLAGELSLLASLAEGTLAKTHARLGR